MGAIIQHDLGCNTFVIQSVFRAAGLFLLEKILLSDMLLEKTIALVFDLIDFYEDLEM